jgi:hypothetical protein
MRGRSDKQSSRYAPKNWGASTGRGGPFREKLGEFSVGASPFLFASAGLAENPLRSSGRLLSAITCTDFNNPCLTFHGFIGEI